MYTDKKLDLNLTMTFTVVFSSSRGSGVTATDFNHGNPLIKWKTPTSQVGLDKWGHYSVVQHLIVWNLSLRSVS